MTPEQHEAILSELRAHTQLLSDLLKSSVASEPQGPVTLHVNEPSPEAKAEYKRLWRLFVTGKSAEPQPAPRTDLLQMVCSRCAYPRKIDIVDTSTPMLPYSALFGRADPCPSCGLGTSPSPRRVQP